MAPTPAPQPMTPAYTADSAMEPDWSMAMTSSRWMAGASRPKPMTCSGTRVRRSGSQWRRLAWMVRFQSMSPGPGPAGAAGAAAARR